VPEETYRAKRDPALPDPVNRFIERVGGEPKHGADFPEKIAAQMADSLHDHYRVGRQSLAGRALACVSIGHVGGEVALLHRQLKVLANTLESGEELSPMTFSGEINVAI
jgi:hypothetical protein